MCDTKGHDHWCSVCGKNLNRVRRDSYVEIEWSQNDKGQIIEEKSMICNDCLEESDNIRELNVFYENLKYSPWGHVFCSGCKKDLTKEIGKNIKPGVDYECLSFKCHQKSGPNIKHIIKVVVLCSDCMKQEFNANNVEKLKKLGRNPKFSPIVVCDKIDRCGQYEKGDKNINCKHIVIGRDRETLNMAILCGRKHKGALVVPFDDGVSIVRPRKGGAALANPVIPVVNPIQDYVKQIEELLKKYKLGKYGEAKFLALEKRIENIELALGIKTITIEPNKEINHALQIKETENG